MSDTQPSPVQKSHQVTPCHSSVHNCCHLNHDTDVTQTPIIRGRPCNPRNQIVWPGVAVTDRLWKSLYVLCGHQLFTGAKMQWGAHCQSSSPAHLINIYQILQKILRIWTPHTTFYRSNETFARHNYFSALELFAGRRPVKTWIVQNINL